MMEKYRISVGNHSNKGLVKNKTVAWDWLSDRLCQFEVRSDKKGAFFVGGQFKNGERVDTNMTSRSLLTLDLDTFGGDLQELETLLEDIPCAYVAYSTFNHTNEKPRIRIVLPLSREVGKKEFSNLSMSFCKTLTGLDFDPCSFKFNQFMYLPIVREGDQGWFKKGEGDALDVDQYVIESIDEDDGDLEDFLNAQPLDMSSDDIDRWLACINPEDCGYHQWSTIGMALHHQYGGGEIGLNRWVKWSRDDHRFKDGECERKWSSFKVKDRPVTMASVVHIAKEHAPGVFDGLVDEAETITDIKAFETFADKVMAVPRGVLSPVQVTSIANALHTSFGQDAGVSKGDIKKSLVKSKKDFKDNQKQTWMENWYYIETSCQFYNSELNYAIKTEAFNVKFARVPQVKASEVSAAHYASAMVTEPLPCVVDTMYFPGADLVFDYEGKAMINTYRERGVTTEGVDLNTDKAKEVIQRFNKHLENTIEHEDERRTFLDWLCHICQHPGETVNWAVLLQGSQGTGKTYFVNVLQTALGENVFNLNPNAIGSQFNGWAQGSTVIAVEEIKISNTDKYKLLNQLKPIISNTTVAVEQKGKDQKSVPNFSNYFFLTNHPDAIPINDDDRRYFILFTKWQSYGMMKKDLGDDNACTLYFDQLFDDLTNHGAIIAKYLKTRVISEGFNYKGRAPKTAARSDVINMSASSDECLLDDLIDTYGCPVISERIIDSTYLKQSCDADCVEMPRTHVFSAIMLDRGYRKIPGRFIKISGVKHYLWYSVEHFEDVEDVKTEARDYHLGGDSSLVPF